MLNWQFYNENVVKYEETSSTQNNVNETEEQKDFCVEQHHKRNCKRKKKISSVEQKTVEKKSRKKTKTGG